MKKYLSLLTNLTILTCVLLPSLSLAGEEQQDSAPSYYQENCIQCHQQMVSGDGSLLYGYQGSSIANYKALLARVRYCQKSLSLQWSTEQVNSVAQYLNRHYYEFKQ